MDIVKSGIKEQLDVLRLREQFPVLEREVHGKPLVYLDNAATAQRPLSVIEAMDDFYRRYNANVHRGVHQLSVEASEAFETARKDVARLLNATSDREVIFTRGTTEAINLVANSYLRPRVKAGDEILISHMEHHSNIVPWQLLCEQTGAVLKVIPINEKGELMLDALEDLIGERTRLLGLVHVSNALGTVNPVREVCEIARRHGVPVLIDGAQATPHEQVDVQAIGCDFYAMSAHKMYGPTGIGALWGREALLEEMPPWQGGGEMILRVSFDETTYNELPHKFEAGTPNISGAIGLGAAVRFLFDTGIEKIARHEQALLEYATERMSKIEGLRIIGQAAHKGPVIAFTLDGVHPNDIGTIIDHHGVAIRTGHHCAMPVMQFFDVPATARVSFAAYNLRAEIDVFLNALEKARQMLV
ncbi:cysteine desulfurase [Wenzhouxiangella marina]|uniref:Cysteine desulfurase n=1 Tax=Wenzhouxiangella marina TaxID=1579979 RepID=A0A0K0XYP8_9GAMM|nr:cysteine desulfurase [Wenzhouxiangella marina]AKS42813.1 Cysteine desulfurase [Wenzhouxiangella marina]MBB6087508.1 cysteine desulfurase/selenocysteine lyase [Wenzhouxiangella marina]